VHEGSQPEEAFTHTLRVHRPTTQLRPYVRVFAQREIGRAGFPLIEPTIAQLEQNLTFDFGTPVEVLWPDARLGLINRTSTAGAQTRFAAHMRLRAGVESFGIFFGPTGFSRLFGIPMSELTNRLDDATAIAANQSAISGTDWGIAAHLRIAF
jgi:hypothetical protein